MFLPKLSPEFTATLSKHGYIEPKTLQKEGVAKLIAGGDLVAIGPKGSGKTSLIAMALIHKLEAAFEDAPRAVVFVKNKEAALALQEQCMLLSKHTDLRFLCAFEGKFWKDQLEAIYIGCDVVIGTVSRLQEIYFKNGLNVSQLKLVAVDDAHTINHVTQVQLERMFLSTPKKCQRIICADKEHDRIERMGEEHYPHALYIEAED